MRNVTKVLCANCRSLHEFTIQERERTVNVNGNEYTYTEKFALCKRCNSRVTVPGLADDNSRALDGAIAASKEQEAANE